MPCEVTRASSKTTTQIARPDIHVIFPGSDPEAYICLQTITAYLETQETIWVIIAPADTADSSAGRYTLR